MREGDMDTPIYNENTLTVISETDGKRYKLLLKGDITKLSVHKIKRNLSLPSNINIDEQELYFNNQLLNDNDSAFTKGVRDGSVLHLKKRADTKKRVFGNEDTQSQSQSRAGNPSSFYPIRADQVQMQQIQKLQELVQQMQSITSQAQPGHFDCASSGSRHNMGDLTTPSLTGAIVPSTGERSIMKILDTQRECERFIGELQREKADLQHEKENYRVQSSVLQQQIQQSIMLQEQLQLSQQRLEQQLSIQNELFHKQVQMEEKTPTPLLYKPGPQGLQSDGLPPRGPTPHDARPSPSMFAKAGFPPPSPMQRPSHSPSVTQASSTPSAGPTGLSLAQLNLDNLAKELGVAGGLRFDENLTCAVGVEEKYTVLLTYDATTERLYIYSPLLTQLPRRAEARLHLYECLLEGALLGRDMAGGGVGISLKNDLVLITTSIDLKHCDAYSLKSLTPTFVDCLVKWKQVASDSVQLFKEKETEYAQFQQHQLQQQQTQQQQPPQQQQQQQQQTQPQLTGMNAGARSAALMGIGAMSGPALGFAKSPKPKLKATLPPHIPQPHSKGDLQHMSPHDALTAQSYEKEGFGNGPGGHPPPSHTTTALKAPSFPAAPALQAGLSGLSGHGQLGQTLVGQRQAPVHSQSQGQLGQVFIHGQPQSHSLGQAGLAAGHGQTGQQFSLGSFSHSGIAASATDSHTSASQRAPFTNVSNTFKSNFPNSSIYDTANVGQGEVKNIADPISQYKNSTIDATHPQTQSNFALTAEMHAAAARLSPGRAFGAGVTHPTNMPNGASTFQQPPQSNTAAPPRLYGYS